MDNEHFSEKSYKSHENHMKQYLHGDKRSHSEKWLEKGTVDDWRHERMYQMVDPFLFAFPESYWLTIGDGRYGKDAQYLEKRGATAVATDICDDLLKIAASRGLVQNYKKENAEMLSFPNGEFDFVLCKESYHHFPRPMIALYEMIRVSKKGVILIEPTDFHVSSRILHHLTQRLKIFSKKLRKKKFEPYSFEESGNFIYPVSEREIEKTALGLNLKAVAFKGLNDHYVKGAEDELAQNNSKLFRKVKFRIYKKDLYCKLGLKPYDMLVSAIFKINLDRDVHNTMAMHGFKIVNLPENPYI